MTSAASDSRDLAARLQAVLEGDSAAIRQTAREFLTYTPYPALGPDTPKEIHREHMLAWVQEMVRAGFTKMPYAKAYGGTEQYKDYMNIVEVISHFDLSLAVKQGVNFGLFGLGVAALGTEKHHAAHLPDLIDGKLLGGFAMTEVSGGSDVQSVGTVAVYDHATRSFTLNTPDDGARKAYIGNAALHGQMMVVFAQLKMSPDAEESMGVHAFLLPVRGADGKLLQGVEIEDCGHKIGLNGVDNGYIRFTDIKMPYDALLDRFASIDADGKYQSPVEKKTARFFKMISTLVTGRVFVSMASLSGAKNALKNALDFAAERKVFGDTLLDKQATQSRMLPHLAQAYALHFTTRDMIDKQIAGAPDLETMAAAIKSRASDHAINTIDEARRLAGGLGYMTHEKYGLLRNDIDIFRTFEGDNTVLRMLAAKNRLTDMGKAFNKASAIGKIKHVFNRKASPLTAKKSRTSENHLRDTSFHLDILARREQAMLFDLAQKMKKLHKRHGAEGLNLCQDDMTAYAEAYADRVMMESFARHIAAQQDAEVKDTLKKLADLFALDTLRRNGLWYVENGFMSTSKTRAIANVQHQVQAEIAPLSGTLVNAFAIPEKALKLPRPDNTQKKSNDIRP